MSDPATEAATGLLGAISAMILNGTALVVVLKQILELVLEKDGPPELRLLREQLEQSQQNMKNLNDTLNRLIDRLL